MRRKMTLRIILAAAVAFAMGAPVRAAELSALIGMDPPSVRRELAAVAAEWPTQPAFTMATPEGVLTFITVGDLMLDPALAERLAVFRTQGDRPPVRPFLICRTTLNDDAWASAVVLVFRDGRLASAFRRIEPKLAPPPASAGEKAQKAYVRRPVTTPFLARPGELPLEDGLGFLARETQAPLAPDDRLTADCAPPPRPATPPRTQGRRGLDASDLQGLALLPFAVTLPGKNRQRTSAAQDGPPLLATLRVGAPLGATPEAFAAAHKGVRAYRAKAGDYAVLSLDLGGAPGRNLTNSNDAALLGVRAGRIEWIAPPASYGPHPGLFCLDDQNVPNAPRPGCSGWGHFNP